MILLNLETKNKQEEIIKDYLQNNATEMLANKINNGITITKDGKELISKKDLKGFMDYACKQAKEQSEKGSSSAMIEDSVVFGWAIHYFEEDSIEGTLYNLDNTIYEAPKPKISTPTIIAPQKKENKQPSLFDMIEQANYSKQEDVEPETEDNEEWTEDEIQDTMEEIHEEEKKKDNPTVDEICERVEKAMAEKYNPSPVYTKYKELEKKYPDCIIAIRLGDFYEIFGDNAKVVSNELDLTLTGRDCGLPERIPMVGFPYHAGEKYISKMIEKGHKVAIIEKDNEYMKTPNCNVDMTTGEVIEKNNELVDILQEQLGDIFEVVL